MQPHSKFKIYKTEGSKFRLNVGRTNHTDHEAQTSYVHVRALVTRGTVLYHVSDVTWEKLAGEEEHLNGVSILQNRICVNLKKAHITT